MCAAKELHILGVRFATEYLDALRRTAAGRPKHRGNVVKEAKATDVEPMSNLEFAYDAWHSAADLPFGITWEEKEGLEGDDVPFTEDDFGQGRF
jgi:hypothetical protein